MIMLFFCVCAGLEIKRKRFINPHESDEGAYNSEHTVVFKIWPNCIQSTSRAQSNEQTEHHRVQEVMLRIAKGQNGKTSQRETIM